jgi:hypothetical protein
VAPVSRIGTSPGRLHPLSQPGNKRNSAVTLRLDAVEMRALYGFFALGSHFAASLSEEYSQFSPDELKTHIAAIATAAATTLIRKISVAAAAVHNQTEAEMTTEDDVAPPSEAGDHYREVASTLRLVASRTRFPNVRREILDLASRYERRGHHFDARVAAGEIEPPGSS